jgi:hypothetical protein
LRSSSILAVALSGAWPIVAKPDLAPAEVRVVAGVIAGVAAPNTSRKRQQGLLF